MFLIAKKTNRHESKLVMWRNLWLPFQLTSVYTLHVGVGKTLKNALLMIDRRMIDQRALFDNFVFSWSIDQKKS